MKAVFAIAAALLILGAAGMIATSRDGASDVPVLRWSTNPMPPIRQEQIAGFERWLVRHGHVTADGGPICRVRLDPSDFSMTKMIMQGVSGVSADLIDAASGNQLHYLQKVGIVADLEPHAAAAGFDLARTWPALEPELTVAGRQYAFPRLVTAFMFNVNVETFEAAGMSPPPVRWTLEAFEDMGRRFVAAANEPGARQTTFFANEVRAVNLHRSLGLSIFNETLTRCTLDDPRYARVLELIYKWKHEDHILPTEVQLKSIATHQETQFGASRERLFMDGGYAMIYVGRHSLPLLRPLGRVRMSVAEPPHGGFPNTSATSTCTAVYSGSARPDLARLFLAYLASEAYSMQAAHNADGLPPDPAVTTRDAYLHPPDHENEWDCHAALAAAMRDSAIAGVFSPFVEPAQVNDVVWEEEQAFMADRYGAAEAGRRTAERINAKIERNLRENAALRESYEDLSVLQAKIERRRGQGRPMPRGWIGNGFHRRYYEFRGWLE